MESWLPECPFHALTGFYCSGCGVTRLVWLSAHGHLLLAARENMLVAALVPVVLVGMLAWARGWRPSQRVQARLGFGLAGLVILFTLARNLPVEPLRQLAPVPLAELLRS